MKAKMVLLALRAQKVDLFLVGDSLRFRSPRDLTNSERQAVAENREEIIRLVREAERLRNLAESGKTDLDVADLDEALFLFAWGRVTGANGKPGSLERFLPFWRQRLAPGAWDFLSLEA